MKDRGKRTGKKEKSRIEKVREGGSEEESSSSGSEGRGSQRDKLALGAGLLS